MTRGKYIVIEGLANYREDILQRLAAELSAAQLPVKIFREPESQNDLTARALNRLTHDPRYPMTTRTEVLLYNAARVQSLETIRQAVEEGVICLVDRSFLTTLAVQYYGYGELHDYSRINDIIDFAVNDFRPDLTIVLDTPVAELDTKVREKFLTRRSSGDQSAYLERVRAGYLWEAQQRSMPVVYATQDVDQVFKAVWKYVADALAVRDRSNASKPESVAAVLAANPLAKVSAAEPPVLQNASSEDSTPAVTNGVATDASPTARPRYFIPPTVDRSLASQYKSCLNKILKKYDQIRKALSPEDAALARLVLPIACSVEEAAGDVRLAASNSLKELAQNMLQNDYGEASDDPVRLIDHWPRNELMMVASLLYPVTGLRLDTLRNQTGNWSYAQKAEVIRHATSDGHSSALEEVGYLYELFISYADLAALRQQPSAQVVHQYLSPRYGFEVPDAIQTAGMTEVFEDCFDLSLQLHSQLQGAGLEAEAQYATLLGHKHYAKLTLSGAALRKLEPGNNLPAALIAELQATAAEVHPLLGEGMTVKHPVST